MSGRHTGRTSQGPAIRTLPKTLKLVARLAPRQINDEIALAKVELKRKATQLGVAGAFFGVALVFLALLVIALVVAAILALATIMPGWLAALIVAAFFLVIVAIAGLIGLARFKKAMPLIPEDTIRGIRHDLGIAKEGSAFDASILDPNSPAAKAAKAEKEAAAQKAKAEKAAKEAAKEADAVKAPTEAELRSRLTRRREHLTGVRDELGEQLDVKTQGRALWESANGKFQEGREFAGERISGLGGSVPGGLSARIAARWKDLAAFVTAAAVFIVAVRKLLQK
ncbi:phage holin family protein [Arthrobacter sp. efr-133-TYG-104]|uniref:phage holin family protein n=1 Tax=Arthrobacter sp. efr-133-TYG-104 TaxID=3040324 RepID=UPI00254BE80E|nr:phage holin family protein [Arthrobacter sp. efr-133-TYG-104]